MTVRSWLGAQRRNLLTRAYRRRAFLGRIGNVVSFTFDDFPRSAYSIAGPILKGYGAQATYYAALGLVGIDNHLGEHFRLEDLDALRAEGHELGNHTFSHVSARSVRIERFISDVKKGSSALTNRDGFGTSHNFAYPFGDVTVRSKRAVGSIVKSARGIMPGLNGPEVDLNLLRANRLYGDMECVEATKKLILENERRHSWLIFYTHDVRTRPSQYGCTPQLFESVLSFVLKRGALVLPVSKVLQEVDAAGESAQAHP